jgi:thioredoxin-like negative regulator of GroEL
MNCRRIVLSLVALGILLPAAAASEIDWQTNLRPALKSSAATGKPVLVDVWAIWCVPCKAMDETTYRDPEVVRAIEEFIPVKVDHDLQELFVERYDVGALPLVLFLDVEGREISRMMGVIEPEPLLAIMASVRDGYADYLKAMAKPKDVDAVESVASYLLAAGNPSEASRFYRRALKNLDDDSPSRREPLELRLAQAQLAADELKPAAATFERLSTSAAERRVRGLALEGLARVQRKKGSEEAAAATLERLRSEYPDVSAEVPAVRAEQP